MDQRQRVGEEDVMCRGGCGREIATVNAKVGSGCLGCLLLNGWSVTSRHAAIRRDREVLSRVKPCLFDSKE